jgi:hypothetical protein
MGPARRPCPTRRHIFIQPQECRDRRFECLSAGFTLDITLRNVRLDPFGTLVRGEVRATDAPKIAIPIPPIPVAAIPEPAGAAALMIGTGLLFQRRRQR